MSVLHIDSLEYGERLYRAVLLFRQRRVNVTQPLISPDNAPHNHQEGTIGPCFTGSSGVRK